jgi:hypothetical protein
MKNTEIILPKSIIDLCKITAVKSCTCNAINENDYDIIIKSKIIEFDGRIKHLVLCEPFGAYDIIVIKKFLKNEFSKLCSIARMTIKQKQLEEKAYEEKAYEEKDCEKCAHWSITKVEFEKSLIAFCNLGVKGTITGFKGFYCSKFTRKINKSNKETNDEI